MKFIYNDGGRALAGFKGDARDCVCRAIAITSGRPYIEIYNRLAEGNANQRASKRQGKKAKTARSGINTGRKWFKDYMVELGYTWTSTMFIGQGCKTHLTPDELPAGRIIAKVSRHFTAVIDGVIHDTFDPSRDRSRCVYGYWELKKGGL